VGAGGPGALETKAAGWHPDVRGRRRPEEQFVKRSSLMMLWQEIAENFYPERAEFTINRALGTDFGAGMMTSYPFLCRRDLGDQLGQMLRSE
jgi:hypothetical protein